MSKLRMMENFVRVAQRGSLSLVARDVGLTPSALSKQMNELERQLGVSLAVRGRNQEVTLTPEGKYYLDEVAPLLERLKEVDSRVANLSERRRLLRIRAPRVLAEHLVVPGIAAFANKHPNLTIQYLTDDSDGEEDLAMSVSMARLHVIDGRGSARSDDVVVLGCQVWVAIASSKSQLLAVSDPRELRAACMLKLGELQDQWLFSRGGETSQVRLSPSEVSAEPSLVISSIRDGMALMPLWAAQSALRSPDFRRLFPEWDIAPAAGPGKVILNVPATKAPLPVVKSFITHMQRQLQEADVLRPD